MVLSNGFFYERIQLDTINERFNKVPTAKEGDANGRGMIVVLTENGLVKNTTGVSLLFKWEHTRISGAQGLEDFEPLDLTKGEYIVTYPAEMNHEGYVKAEIRIIDNGKYAGSRNMKIQVEPSVGDDTAMESSNQFSALVTALLQVNSWNTTIDGKIVEWEADMAATKQLYIDNMEEVEATYPQELVSISQQLEQAVKKSEVQSLVANKAEKTYVDSELSGKASVSELSNILDGTPKGVYPTLGDLQAAFPMGTQGVYLVTDNGHIYSWGGSVWSDLGVYQAVGISKESIGTLEMKRKSVTIDRTDFFIPKTNLFNSDAVEVNTGIDLITGDLKQNALYNTLTLPVNAGLSYTTKDVYRRAFYTKDMMIISTEQADGTFFTPSNCYYLRVLVAHSNLFNAQVNLGDVTLPYEPFLFQSDKLIVKGDRVHDLVITNNELDSMDVSTNLFDDSKTILGYSISSVDGELVISQNYSSTELILVKPGKYSIKGFNKFAFYDKNKNFISVDGPLSTHYSGVTLYTPLNTSYIRMQFENSSTITRQLNKGDNLLPYEKYYSRIKNLQVNVRDTDFIKISSKNFFNKYEILNKKSISSATGEVVDNQFNTVTEFIPFNEKVLYTTSRIGAIAYYDINKKFISRQSTGVPDADTPFSGETPVGTRFIRISSGYPWFAQLHVGTSIPQIDVDNFNISINGMRFKQKDLFEYHDMYLLDGDFDSAYIAEQQLAYPGVDSIISTDIYAIFDNLLTSFPDMMTKSTIGTSVNGKPIYMYTCESNTGIKTTTTRMQQKPKAIAISGTHPEKVSAYTFAKMFELIIESTFADGQLYDLRENFKWVIIPVHNPDGFDANTRFNANNVNIERNFEQGWKYQSLAQYPLDYSGESPLSEPETIALFNLLKENKDAVAYMSFHNSSQVSGEEHVLAWGSSGTKFATRAMVKYLQRVSRVWLGRYDWLRGLNKNICGHVSEQARPTIGSSKNQAAFFGIHGYVSENNNRFLASPEGTENNTADVMTVALEAQINFMITVLKESVEFYNKY